MPIKSNCWLGTNLYLLKLMTQPGCCSTCRTKSAWARACTEEKALISHCPSRHGAWHLWVAEAGPLIAATWWIPILKLPSHTGGTKTSTLDRSPWMRHISVHALPWEHEGMPSVFRWTLSIRPLWWPTGQNQQSSSRTISNNQMVVQAGEVYDRMQVTCLLQHQKKTAEDTFDFWFVDQLYCPLGQEHVHSHLQVLGRIPGAEWQGLPGQWRIRHPLQLNPVPKSVWHMTLPSSFCHLREKPAKGAPTLST